MASRICFILTCIIAFTGCYTQLRAPRVHREQRAESPIRPPEESVQRFEYYYYNYCNPSPLPFYGPYNPYRPYRPYRRYPLWNRHRLIWEYSSWASVYDPWWRGWSPRILVPHIVYAPAVRPDIEREQVNPRPRIRYTGVRGGPASASAIRSGSTSTESTQQTGNSRSTKKENTQQTGNSRSTKTQSAEKSEKKEEKSEKREEKRSTQRRRGGMR